MTPSPTLAKGKKLNLFQRILHKLIGHWWITGISMPGDWDWKQECIICHEVRSVH